MSKAATQTGRVIRAARSYRGVSQVDFLAPDVVDGGSPITRLAARLWEAEQQGYDFECLGRRDKCKVWRLCREPNLSSPDGGIERTVGISDAACLAASDGRGAATCHPSAKDGVSRKAPVRSGDAGLISRASAGGSLSAEPTLFDLPVPGPVSPYEEAA